MSRAFNSRDVAGTDAALHFPHVRLASGKVRLMEEGGQPPDMFERFARAVGWACSRWDYRSSRLLTRFPVALSTCRSDANARDSPRHAHMGGAVFVPYAPGFRCSSVSAEDAPDPVSERKPGT